MFVVVVAMVSILGITAWVIGLAALGVRGRGLDRAPGIAARFEEAARHFNGEAETPEPFRRFAEKRLTRAGSRPS